MDRTEATVEIGYGAENNKGTLYANQSRGQNSSTTWAKPAHTYIIELPIPKEEVEGLIVQEAAYLQMVDFQIGQYNVFLMSRERENLALLNQKTEKFRNKLIFLAGGLGLHLLQGNNHIFLVVVRKDIPDRATAGRIGSAITKATKTARALGSLVSSAVEDIRASRHSFTFEALRVLRFSEDPARAEDQIRTVLRGFCEEINANVNYDNDTSTERIMEL